MFLKNSEKMFWAVLKWVIDVCGIQGQISHSEI